MPVLQKAWSISCILWLMQIVRQAVSGQTGVNPEQKQWHDLEKPANQKKAVEGTVRYLWPIHQRTYPLSEPRIINTGVKWPKGYPRQGWEPRKFADDLAKLAQDGFTHFRNKILPQLMEKDPSFKSDFLKADHSRVNRAFHIWQKLVYAKYHNIDPEMLTGNGEKAVPVEGVEYTWPELYQHPNLAKLHSRLSDLSKLYLQDSGYEHILEDLNGQDFRIFIWTEVYHRGDFMRPMIRTEGAYLYGIYAAQSHLSTEKGAMEISFQDLRGVNPPFGRSNVQKLGDGQVILFPSWATYLIAPNGYNTTRVLYNFVVYRPDGVQFDFEDDLLGDFRPEMKLQIPRSGTNLGAMRPTAGLFDAQLPLDT